MQSSVRRHPFAARTAARFLRRSDGALSTLMVFLIPAFILIFAAAIDISHLNAQRRYVQAQADLSALSAVQRLPHAPNARQVARDVTVRNPQYGRVSLADDHVVFGNYAAVTRFVAAPDQAAERGLDAVAVTVHSQWKPILLQPFYEDKLWVIRSAIAARRDVAAFTLRNALLRVDTSRSILDAILADQLQLNASVLSYEGLALTHVSANDLAGIVRTETGLKLLTFSEVLDAQLTYGQLLNGLATRGYLPFAALAGVPQESLQLGHLLSVTPEAARLYDASVLPDLRISMFDLLFAMANLSGQHTHHRINVAGGLDAAPLASPALSLDLVDPGVTVAGLVHGPTPLRADVAQVRLTATGQLAGLADVGLDLQTGVASATLISLNCAAREPEDIVAVFEVETHPATLGISTRLLAEVEGTHPERTAPVSVAGHSHMVQVTLADVGSPVQVDNPIMVSAVAQSLATTMERLQEDLAATGGGVGGLLNPLVQPLLSLVSGLIDDLSEAIADRPLLDGAAQALLDLAGIRVAQADLILHGYGCSSALVE